MSRPNSDRHRDHDQWDELAVGYALTALEPDEMERFIDHLVAFCPQCQQSVDDTAAVGAELAIALPTPVVAPSAKLRDSVLGAAFAARTPVPQSATSLERSAVVTPLPRRSETMSVEAGASSNGTGVNAPVAKAGQGSGAHRVVDLDDRRARRPGRSAGWLVAAAAAVVAVVMSVTAVMSIQSRSRTAADAGRYQSAVTEALGSSGRIVVLKNTAGNDVASVVAHSNTVSVVSLNMSPNSASSTYVLWGINGKTASPIALGVFDVASTKVQTTRVQTDSRGYSSFRSYAVSHEPGRTAPASPTTIVASG